MLPISFSYSQYWSPLLVLHQDMDHPLLTPNFTLLFKGHHLPSRTALLTSSGPMWTHYLFSSSLSRDSATLNDTPAIWSARLPTERRDPHV